MKKFIQKDEDSNINTLISTLINAKGSTTIAVMSLGSIMLVYNGTNVIYRYKCSSPLAASKTADRIQKAYDAGFFVDAQMM